LRELAVQQRVAELESLPRACLDTIAELVLARDHHRALRIEVTSIPRSNSVDLGSNKSLSGGRQSLGSLEQTPDRAGVAAETIRTRTAAVAIDLCINGKRMALTRVPISAFCH
jgi:hypothetical protein